MRRSTLAFAAFFFSLITLLTLHPREALPQKPTASLDGKHIAILMGEGVLDSEALFPIGYLESYGAQTTVIGVKQGKIQTSDQELTLQVEHSVKDVDVNQFDALVIPGGSSPEHLREHDFVVSFARQFFQTGKPVAAVCHGPQLLISAGVMEGKRATCYHTVQQELEAAGVNYIDQAMVRDGNLITSRNPGDLPAFSKALHQALAK